MPALPLQPAVWEGACQWLGSMSRGTQVFLEMQIDNPWLMPPPFHLLWAWKGADGWDCAEHRNMLVTWRSFFTGSVAPDGEPQGSTLCPALRCPLKRSRRRLLALAKLCAR